MGGMNVRHIFLLNIVPGKYYNGRISSKLLHLLLHEYKMCRTWQKPGISAWNSVDSNVNKGK